MPGGSGMQLGEKMCSSNILHKEPPAELIILSQQTYDPTTYFASLRTKLLKSLGLPIGN